jgi:hypothetical protein
LPAVQSGGWFDRHCSPRQSAAVSRTAWFGVRVHTGFELADGDDLIPGHDSDGEGAGPAAQDDVGAVVGALQGWDDTAAAYPDNGGVLSLFTHHVRWDAQQLPIDGLAWLIKPWLAQILLLIAVSTQTLTNHTHHGYNNIRHSVTASRYTLNFFTFYT